MRFAAPLLELSEAAGFDSVFDSDFDSEDLSDDFSEDFSEDFSDDLSPVFACAESPDPSLAAGADCVYGSRVKGQIRAAGWSVTPGKHPSQGLGPWFAGVVLSLWTLLLYGRWISDTLTAYKLYPAKVLKAIQIETRGFETDHEITAKLIRRGLRITEVPISYRPRSLAEGKKIKPRDGLIAVWTLLKFRFKK